MYINEKQENIIKLVQEMIESKQKNLIELKTKIKDLIKDEKILSKQIHIAETWIKIQKLEKEEKIPCTAEEFVE